MAAQDAATRQTIAQEIATLRVEMSVQDATTRLTAAREISQLRVDISSESARAEARHRELLKWTFIFWVGQAAAVAGLLKALT